MVSVRHLIQIDHLVAPASRPAAQEHQEEIMHPVIMRQLAAARPAATPIKNTDQNTGQGE
jgi:hypothetical protein